MDNELTEEEKKAIRSLKSLAKKWPKSLWLFSASGRLHVMKCKADGKKAIDFYGSMDENYSADTIDIPNDGGDW